MTTAGNDDLWSLLDSLRDTIAKFGIKDDPEDDEDMICSACGHKGLTIDDGQQICTKCSTITGRVIESGAEWRFYGADDNRDDDPTRCGLPTNELLPKSSLGSMIGGRKGESRDFRRIRMYQMWNSMPYWERSLYNVFDQLASNTINHGIPSKVLDDAKVLYKKASEKKISRGENKEGLIASCIYYACLINKVPRSPKEVSKMFNIDPNVLTKGNARFQTLLQLNVDSTGPDDFISRFGSKLNMNYNDIQACKKLAQKLDELEIVSENAPTSVAAGTIFYYCMANEIDFNKKQIAEICDVSEVTITKCYKRLQKYKHLFALSST
jgi:transcription initiation factor TFIIIB Brf1 subunit/transcription initiation factor TFIIB